MVARQVLKTLGDRHGSDLSGSVVTEDTVLDAEVTELLLVMGREWE